MTINPYLFFSGDCAEAFRFYQGIFGGDLEIMTNADAPDGVDPMPGAPSSAVMHAALTMPDAVLMGSDDPSGDGGPKTGVAITFTAPDVDNARKVFDAISVGGDVLMPFEPTFYSTGFGSCTDRFGVAWMVDTASES